MLNLSWPLGCYEPDNIFLMKELLAISLVRSPDLGALSCVPDHFDGMALSDTLDDEVIGNEDIRRSQPVAIGTGQIMNPFPFKGLGIIPSEAKVQEAPFLF